MRRGDVWIAAGGPDYAGKPRPVVVVQSDRFDATSSITVCGLTTIPIERPWARLPIVPAAENGLQRPSWLMVDKLATLRRSKLDRQIGRLSAEDIQRLDNAIMVFLGLSS